MSADFPLVESLGVEVRNGAITSVEMHENGGMAGLRERIDYVRAADLEAALAKAPVVYGAERVPGTLNREWIAPLTERNEPIGSTHTARLVCVQPIVRDTADALVRALADRPLRGDPNDELIQRARKLLDGGK